jgi:RHS repeat-associated protein
MNAFGELTNYKSGSGTSANTTALQYDTHGRNYSRTNGTLYNFSLSFNPNGTIQQSSDSNNGAWQYSYDSFGRLNAATETSPSQSFSYQYDQYGNRWGTNSACSSTNPTACQFQFDVHNHITNGGIIYDAAGNMTYDGTFTYTYDAEGRITKVSQGSKQVASYIYDALGHRTQEAVGTATYAFLFDFAGRPFEKLEYTSANGEFFQQTRLFAGVIPIGYYNSTSASSTGGTDFFISDWKGTLSQITGPSGSSQGSCSGYLPFGDGGTCTGNGSTFGKPGYAGMWNDPETGLDKTDTRFLSPVQGRFLTPDPARSGWNIYVYGNNDPVSQTDPSGLFLDSDGDFGYGNCGWGCTDDGSEPQSLSQFVFIAPDPDPLDLPSDGGSILTLPPGSGSAMLETGGGQGGGDCSQCSGFSAGTSDFIKREIFSAFTTPVGAPSFAVSLIPVVGSGLSSIHDFQTGHWGWGLFHAGMAVSDLFLVKSLATAGGKLAFAGIAALSERSAIGATGKVGEAALQRLVGGVPAYFPTGLGRRFVDNFAEGVAHESKVGYTAATDFAKRQAAKDAWLVMNGDIKRAVWHFYESPVTGLVGPSGPLREFLEQLGIEIVCPACPK